MAVKILIKRTVPKEKEGDLSPLLHQLRAQAIALPDYISGETLRKVDLPEEYMIISTWKSVDAWREWETSEQRKQIQEKIDTLLGEKTEYSIYHYGE